MLRSLYDRVLALSANRRAPAWLAVISFAESSFFPIPPDALLLPMARTRWGRIVSVSSVAAVLGNRGQTNYAAAKAALHGASKSLAREMAARNITVNAIAPGYIETNNTTALREDEDRNAAILGRIPAGRWGKASDLGGAAVFLSSSASDYVDGHILAVDGGAARTL